jgi:hypothetical protein
VSVWSNVVSSNFPLAGVEGALVSVSVSVEPSRLEALLDTLAHLAFPVNPEIFHDGGPAGRATVVEFPAYENRLREIRSLLEECGFPAGLVRTTGMLDSIRCGHTTAY